eukprot:gene3246-13269_t
MGTVVVVNHDRYFLDNVAGWILELDRGGTVVAVTHDRYFLDNVAGWILELDRGAGIPFEEWLNAKDKRFSTEQKQENKLAKNIQRELEWINQKAKGQQKKGQARVNRYDDLVREASEHVKTSAVDSIMIPVGPRLGSEVVVGKGITKGFEDRILVDDMSFDIPPGAIVAEGPTLSVNFKLESRWPTLAAMLGRGQHSPSAPANGLSYATLSANFKPMANTLPNPMANLITSANVSRWPTLSANVSRWPTLSADVSRWPTLSANGIIGGNGAGKSTLFKMIMGMETPDKGIIGGNRAGKSTLLKMIMGMETPDKGMLKMGETTVPMYVDQSREALDADKTVYDVIADGAEEIDLNGRKVNTHAYCSWYNFRSGDQQKKVSMLSGGERNRLHLAKTLKQSGNLLLLDEVGAHLRYLMSHNAIEKFSGSTIIISHDRWFLDKLVTHIMAFEGDSKVFWFEGSYSEYEEDRKKRGLGSSAPTRVKFRKLANKCKRMR